jgi:hypothetical protein
MRRTDIQRCSLGQARPLPALCVLWLRGIPSHNDVMKRSIWPTAQNPGATVAFLSHNLREYFSIGTWAL